jgi:hypothetical protein
MSEPTTQKAASPPRAAQVALACLIGTFVWNSLYYAPYVVDDAFISFRYARNLLEGEGLVYNVGEPIEGYSNFLWVLIAAALMGLELPLLAGTKLLGLVAGGGTIVATWALGRRLFAGHAARESLALVATFLIAASTSLAVWAQAGLETVFFGLLLVTSCLRFEVELERAERRPWSAALFALAWLTRPEAPAYALYFAARRWSARKQAAWGRRDGLWLLACGAIVATYETWGLLTYGRLLPSSHAAKVGSVAGWFERWADQGFGSSLVATFFTNQGWALPALFAAGAVGCCLRPRRVPIAAWAPALAGPVFGLYAWKDWMPRYRLLVPALPFLFLSVTAGLAAFSDARGDARRWAGRLALGVLLAGYAHAQMLGGFERGRRDFGLVGDERPWTWPADVLAHVGQRVYPQEFVAWWILERVPEGETVALGDIGFPGFLTANPVWDVRGLVTASSARWRHDASPEAVEEMLADLRAAKPACILLWARPADASGYMGRFDRTLAASKWITRTYRRTEPEGVTIYLRRDLSAFDTRARIEAALDRLPEYDSELARRARRAIAGNRTGG